MFVMSAMEAVHVLFFFFVNHITLFGKPFKPYICYNKLNNTYKSIGTLSAWQTRYSNIRTVLGRWWLRHPVVSTPRNWYTKTIMLRGLLSEIDICVHAMFLCFLLYVCMCAGCRRLKSFNAFTNKRYASMYVCLCIYEK